MTDPKAPDTTPDALGGKDPMRVAAESLANVLMTHASDPGTLSQALYEVAVQMKQPPETESGSDGTLQALSNLMGGWQPPDEETQKEKPSEAP